MGPISAWFRSRPAAVQSRRPTSRVSGLRAQPGGSTRQYYLGRKTPSLDRIVQGLEKRTADAAHDLARARRLVALLRLGGGNQTDSPSARVIRGLAEAGVFDVGGVLVGTHAFVTLGNLLGVRWTSGSLRTQDVDIAGSREADIDVAVPEIEADVPTALESLKMGFLPVPQAGEVLEQVLENRPGDLELAWDAVDRHGARLSKAVERGLAALGKSRRDLYLRLRRGADRR